MPKEVSTTIRVVQETDGSGQVRAAVVGRGAEVRFHCERMWYQVAGLAPQLLTIPAWAWRMSVRMRCRRFMVLLRIHRKQHVVVKAMFPIVAMTAEIEIDFGTPGKPQLHISLGERHRAIFNNLVLADQPDLRNRVHQF